ncbi:MAG TPA: hypothetical protein VFU49_18420 [Ktedonobacteraceae bacterium]|nr:hypothetical protein [Ktedonobacteraceae bacterium]
MALQPRGQARGPLPGPTPPLAPTGSPRSRIPPIKNHHGTGWAMVARTVGLVGARGRAGADVGALRLPSCQKEKTSHR